MSDVDLDAHYVAVRPSLEAVATLAVDGDAQALGNHDFVGWYQTRPTTRPETLHEGYDRLGKPWLLADDYTGLTDQLDRVLYTTINYQANDAVRWQPFTRGEAGKDWKDDVKPTPGYGDLTAIAPFADIDLADEHKERPLPSAKQETVERALACYRDEFADLAGGRDGVFMLDSVGGAYLFVAPASTAPLAEYFDGDDRERVFKSLVDRMNEWLDDARARVNEQVPDAAGLFEPDLLNNANRLYKAPLSLHSSIDGVVHPLDTDDPEYEFVPFEDVDDDLVAAVETWGAGFTDEAHTDRIDPLVTALWPDYTKDADDWQNALDAWLADERAAEREREIQHTAVVKRREERDRDLSDIETTDHFEDVVDAIEAIDVRDLARDVAAEWDTDPGRDPPRFEPSWRDSSSKTSCFADRDGFTDLGEGANGGNAVTLIAREKRIITNCGQRVTGRDFWDAVEHLRDEGYDIPEFTPSDEENCEHVAILPNTPIECAKRGAGATWDWRARGKNSLELTTDDVRERTLDAIANAYESGDHVLIDAIMSAGKSYGAVKAAAKSDEPITFLTGRGREEQYEQIQEWCDEHGLTSVILPTISDCDTYSGRYEGEHAHAEEQKKIVRRWYDNGATGKDIHIHAEEELGQPLVCDGPAGARCTHKVKWEALDPDDYDVLIGHYNHAHVQNVVESRTLVIDEFPEDTYINEFGPGLASAMTTFLKQHEHVEELPDDYADLMDARTDPERRADALAWLLDHGVERDGTLAFQQGGRATAPLATFTLLASAKNDLGNGFERAELPGQYGDHEGDGVGVYDREKGHVQLLTPPDLRYASGIVALDGTPVHDMWDIVLGASLNHRPVLTDGERAEYITESQNLDIVRTTEYVKPYSGNPENIYLEEDRALLEAIADQHGQKPDLITTQTAETVYETDERGILQSVAEHAHHGNIKGSNRFADSRLGAVIGSRHFGDRYVQLWGALAGERVERGDGRGVDLEYSGIGGEIHKHMTHHETMQAVMRFGRDGNGATVYVHTNTLPDYVPIAGEGRVPKVWSDGMQQVLDAANNLDEWRTADLAAHPAVEIGERQIRDHLHTLTDRGFLSVTVEGRGFVWQNDGLHRVNDHGDVELPPVEIDALTDEEVAELRRMELYTWEFRKNSSESGGAVATDDSDTSEQSNRGDDPPPAASHAN